MPQHMKKIPVFLLMLAAVVFTSCEEVVDVDLPENTIKLVVEGQVTTETDSSFVRLTKTLAYFDNTSAVPLITDAVVTVNGVPFTHDTLGVYRPVKGYVGVTGQVYNLKVTHEGKEYTSSATLEPMFRVDTIISVYKEKEAFIDAGYSVKFVAYDDRPRTKFTYFRFGFKNEIDTKLKDSMFDTRVLFDNRNTILNAPFEFELPFLRLDPNDTALLVFRSTDDAVNRYLQAVTNRDQGGGPFSTPPANLPTNIRGGALGLFAAYDVKRFRARVFE